MKKYWVWITIAGAVILIILAFVCWGTETSWWWFWSALITEVAGLGVYLLVYFIRKKMSKKEPSIEEQKELKKQISQSQAKDILINFLIDEHAEHIEEPEERISHIGRVGTPRIPIYHLWGRGYFENVEIYTLLNMTDTTQKAVLKQKKNENDKSFKARIKEALNEFAQEPEIFEEETSTTESPTGVKTTIKKKKQTVAEAKKKEEEEEKEKAEIIGEKEEKQ